MRAEWHRLLKAGAGAPDRDDFAACGAAALLVGLGAFFLGLANGWF
jgi:hypothetical protein